ncbi:leucine-rich repeat domain-containing protein, partial [Chloroflexota bacterium]
HWKSLIEAVDGALCYSVQTNYPRIEISRGEWIMNRGVALLLVLALLVSNIVIACGPSKGTAEWYALKGGQLVEEGRYDEAMEHCNKATELDPNLVGAYINRATVYITTGRYDEAIEDCDKAIELDPNLAEAYGNRACAYTFLGMDDQAQVDIERAVTLGIDRAGIEAMIEQIRQVERQYTGPAAGTSLNRVTFPDLNLEAAITEAIRKPRGSILPSDLEGLTSLSTENRNITDLTGLEYCINLTHLYLVANQISDISPLASLTNLIWLSLEQNQISDISPLASLTNLTMLDLAGNQISDISPLASLTNLTRLYLGENRISDISPLASLTNLTELRLGRNQISDISPLASLPNLTMLDLEQNPLNTKAVSVYIPQLRERGVSVVYE